MTKKSQSSKGQGPPGISTRARGVVTKRELNTVILLLDSYGVNKAIASALKTETWLPGRQRAWNKFYAGLKAFWHNWEGAK